MEEKVIDCTKIHCQEDLHEMFRQILCFPEWYGCNLDALYDCLTDISGKVRLLDWDVAEDRLGAYGKKAKKVIAAAAVHNTDLDLYL